MNSKLAVFSFFKATICTFPSLLPSLLKTWNCRLLYVLIVISMNSSTNKQIRKLVRKNKGHCYYILLYNKSGYGDIVNFYVVAIVC